jgi:nitrate reductase alpha subunit
MIDFNVRAERMGWLPSAPQLKTNPLQVVRTPMRRASTPKDYVVECAEGRHAAMSCEDPDAPQNWPRNMFVWRSNLLGSVRQGPRVLPQAPARHRERRAGQGPGRAEGGVPSPPK